MGRWVLYLHNFGSESQQLRQPNRMNFSHRISSTSASVGADWRQEKVEPVREDGYRCRGDKSDQIKLYRVLPR
jgi:hypothetical protein